MTAHWIGKDGVNLRDLVKRTDDLMGLVERLTGVVTAMGQSIEVLEAAEKKRSDREDQALRALGSVRQSDWVNERNT